MKKVTIPIDFFLKKKKESKDLPSHFSLWETQFENYSILIDKDENPIVWNKIEGTQLIAFKGYQCIAEKGFIILWEIDSKKGNIFNLETKTAISLLDGPDLLALNDFTEIFFANRPQCFIGSARKRTGIYSPDTFKEIEWKAKDGRTFCLTKSSFSIDWRYSDTTTFLPLWIKSGQVMFFDYRTFEEVEFKRADGSNLGEFRDLRLEHKYDFTYYLITHKDNSVSVFTKDMKEIVWKKADGSTFTALPDYDSYLDWSFKICKGYIKIRLVKSEFEKSTIYGYFNHDLFTEVTEVVIPVNVFDEEN